MPLDLSRVEPGGRRREVEMCAGGGPAVVGCVGRKASPDGVHFDVAEGGGPMVIVKNAGKETALPEMTAKFLGGVAVGGVLAINVHHKEGDGVGAITGDDEVEVIRHQGVRGDADAAFLAMRFKEAEEVFAIGVAGEDSLAVVAALGEMEPVSGRGEAISAGQSGFGASVY